jgi:phage shock protein C
MQKKLTRSNTDKMLCGVCGGLADYFDIDPTMMRAAYVFLSIFAAGFPGLILYICLAIIMPVKS